MTSADPLDGLCFACPAPGDTLPQVNRPRILNAWPQTAPLAGLDRMRINPWVRTFYSPLPPVTFELLQARSDPKLSEPIKRPTTETIFLLRQYFSWFHESMHFHTLDWTPAKELARIYLAATYDCIELMLACKRPDEIQANHRRFLELNSEFEDIREKIRLSEEVFATTLALAKLEDLTKPDGHWHGLIESFADLRNEVCKSLNDLHSGFSRYVTELMPISRLVMKRPPLLSFLVPTLQPVHIERGALIDISHIINHKNSAAPVDVTDSRIYLNSLVKVFDGAEDENKMYDRIGGMFTLWLDSWAAIMSIQLQTIQESLQKSNGYPFAAELWNLSRAVDHQDIASRLRGSGVGQERLEGLTKAVLAIADSVGSFGAYSRVGHPNVGMLRFERTQNDNLIGLYMYMHEDGRRLFSASLRILFFEGVRQQMAKMVGFVCPFSLVGGSRNDPRVCCHEGDMCEGLYRIAQVAVNQGLSPKLPGSDGWFLPPCRGS
jgi:hypothetical protein